MKLMPVSEVKAKLSRLVAEVETRDEEIIITRNGRAAAVLLSADQFEGWRETVEILTDKELMKEIRRGLRAPKRTLTRRQVAALFR
jgi:prevent-host-death family protein